MGIEPPKASEVVDARSFCAWTRAYLGTPSPTLQDLKILNKKASEFFVEYGTDWATLVQVAQWCHQKKRRMGRVWGYVDQYRWAYADGAIDLSTPAEVAVGDSILHALGQETRPEWRSRLRKATGDSRELVLKEWEANRDMVRC